MISPPLVLNEATHRFEWTVDGHTAYEVFERFPGGIAYLHTIVPKELLAVASAARWSSTSWTTRRPRG